MTISEPATLVTDYLLAVFTAILGSQLRRAAWRADAGGFWDIARWRWWLAAAFAATAVAGITGGTVHGFQQTLPPWLAGALWLVTLEALVVAAFAVVGAAVSLVPVTPSARRRVTAAAGVAFAAYGLIVVWNPVYLTAIIAYGAAFAVLVGVRLSARPLDAGGWLLVAGVAVSAAAAAIQQSGWSLHRHFNHNDLYHVVQAVGIWLLYRAAMSDEESKLSTTQTSDRAENTG